MCIRDRLKDGAHFEIRASSERISHWKQELEEANGIVLQAQMGDQKPQEANMDALYNIAAELGTGEWRKEREFTYRLTCLLYTSRCV